MPAKRARNSSGVGGGGAAADGCKRAGACGGAYGGGADSCSLCFYCFAAAKSLRCCPACPAAHCGKPACERKYEAHCAGSALSSEALLAYLVKLRAHETTPHECTLTRLSRKKKHNCDVCTFQSFDMWACIACDHDECQACHERRTR